MSCEEEQAAMDESWANLDEVRAAFGQALDAVEQAVERTEHLCGYSSGTGFVVDPLVPGEPDFPEGSPTCLESLAQWWEEFLEFLPLHYEVKALEEATYEKYEALMECMHGHQGTEAA